MMNGLFVLSTSIQFYETIFIIGSSPKSINRL